MLSTVSLSSKENIWHRRFCHANKQSLQKIANDSLVNGLDVKFNDNFDFCEPCVQGKNHRLTFPKKSATKTNDILELIHSDVCGKVSTPSLGGKNYFVTFIDDFSRYVWVYVIRTKDEVFSKFVEFKQMIEKQTGKCIKTLRSDNGGEYTSNEFDQFLKSEGIRHELTVPNTPEQNGVSERMNRSLVESVRSMLYDAHMPRQFWAEALATSTYVRNRCYSSVLKCKTPYEAFYNKKPDVHDFKIFGCTAYAHIPKEYRSKLDFKSTKCAFLGYGLNVKGYRLYDINKKKVIYSRDVIFNEIVPCFSQKEPVTEQSGGDCYDSTPKTVTIPHDICEDDSVNEVHNEVSLRRSQRNARAPDRYGEWSYQCLSTSNFTEPTSFSEAITADDSQYWKEAMNLEISSMKENAVWDLVEASDDKNIVQCKWIFKKKLGPDGNISKYKARLVAKGFLQRPGIDFNETFSPVVKFESVRTIIALAAQNELKLHQMDVTGAFLHGDLKEEVYMAQPEGFQVPGKEQFVCKLKKSIYGLKQAPRCWNQSLTSYLKSMNFKQSESDPCIFTRTEGELFILAIYVDDIILACKSDSQISKVKAHLSNCFKMTDLGELQYFLGVKIDQDHENNTIFLNQGAYAQRIIDNHGLKEANPVKTPMDPTIKLTPTNDTDELFDEHKYQSALGSLLYLATKTRPDIMYSVGKLARYCSKPSSQHWLALKRVLRYVKGTINYGLLYSKQTSSECVGYSDADWAGDSDRKSTSGYSFHLSGASISWSSSKQSCVALSTAEAEYLALAGAAQEAVWLKKLLIELK